MFTTSSNIPAFELRLPLFLQPGFLRCVEVLNSRFHCRGKAVITYLSLHDHLPLTLPLLPLAFAGHVSVVSPFPIVREGGGERRRRRAGRRRRGRRGEGRKSTEIKTRKQRMMMMGMVMVNVSVVVHHGGKCFLHRLVGFFFSFYKVYIDFNLCFLDRCSLVHIYSSVHSTWP